MTIGTDLERRIRERGVRTRERLELLRLLAGGEDEIRRRIDALQRRIAAAAEKVRSALR